MRSKSIFKIIIGALSLTAIFFTSLHAEEAYHLPPLGKEVVDAGKISYEQGEYKPFIRALNAQMQKAGKMGLLKTIYERMKQATNKKNERNLEQLRLRNQRLLEACATDPNLEICKRVQNVVLFTLTSDEQQALNDIKALRFKFPEGKKAATVEEKLAIVETRFRIMTALLEIAFEKSKADLATRIKKQEALALEKFARMERIAAKDLAWREKIAQARQATEARLANQLDWGVLRDLAAGKIVVNNRAEAEIAQVLREVR